MKLTELEIEEGFVVDKVATEGEIRQRIIEMGFTYGKKGASWRPNRSSYNGL